jgi:hypothetical protein
MTEQGEQIDGPEFDGVDLPRENWTRFPNCVLDNLHMFKPNEFKVLAFMVRKTLGWRKRANKMFAAEYVGARLNMSEKTARTAIDGLEQSGVIRHIGVSGRAGVKMYEVKWRRPVIFTGRQKAPRPVKITADARQKLPTVLETKVIETSSAAAEYMTPKVFKESTKKRSKPKTTEHYPEIEPLLNILSENGVKKSTISTNLKALMFNAQEAHGLEFCESALRGRIIQASNKSQPLWLRTFFDPENGEWMGDCAKLAIGQNNKVIAHPSAVTPEMSALMDEMQAEWKKAQ